MKYYKILNEDLRHRNFRYQEGLNVDTREFDSKSECGGGLFFADADSIFNFLDYGTKIAEVEIPEEELVVPVLDKYKAHSIILKNIRNLNCTETLDALMEEGFDFLPKSACLFRYACENGYLEVAQWIYSLDGEIDIHAENECAFQYACANGHLKLAKWLYSLDKEVDIHTDNDYTFKWACENNHLETAKWLYGLDGKIDIHMNNDQVFRRACENGHLEIAKWLYGLDGKINIHALSEYAFRYACNHGHLKVAKWLYSLDGKIDIHVCEDFVFHWTSPEVLTYINTLE